MKVHELEVWEQGFLPVAAVEFNRFDFQMIQLSVLYIADSQISYLGPADGKLALNLVVVVTVERDHWLFVLVAMKLCLGLDLDQDRFRSRLESYNSIRRCSEEKEIRTNRQTRRIVLYLLEVHPLGVRNLTNCGHRNAVLRAIAMFHCLGPENCIWKHLVKETFLKRLVLVGPIHSAKHTCCEAERAMMKPASTALRKSSDPQTGIIINSDTTQEMLLAGHGKASSQAQQSLNRRKPRRTSWGFPWWNEPST
mmetsp:Transcript_25763/g.64702  ORF Transcript_25763/g.64702 Transcript_25763/m.64702 type:complete len:252 (+) Transcript_25763:772-1527(+)